MRSNYTTTVTAFYRPAV